MTSVQLHLALTHVPVILSLVGLVILSVALLKKNAILTKTSYVIILIAGLAALPVFLSGEGTEEAVEHTPGVSESLIENHQEIATVAMIAVAAAGFFALAALVSFKRFIIARVLRVVVLLLSITAGGLMVQTAHSGGQIRHTEIKNGVVMNGEAPTGENDTRGTNDQEKRQDDD